jgi:hypothetical protein
MTQADEENRHGDLVKDIFFLNIEDAYSEAVKQNKIADDKAAGSPICMAQPPDRVRGMDALHDKGGERLQYCYYDGPLTDIVLNNFIQVPVDSFVEFFSHNHLPIPQIIAISQDGVVHFNEMPVDVIEEINIKRRERDDIINEVKNQLSDKKLSDFLDRDVYFVDPLLALNEAKQKNRVYCGHPTIDGLQVCYYRGELPLHGIENLVHVELTDLVDFFIVSRLRLPEKLEMPNDLEEELKAAVQEDFANALDAIQKKRQAVTLQLAQKAKALKPVVVEGEPIRVFIPGNRLTTVMQYSSQGVAEAFEKRGCQVLFYIEANAMETSNVVDLLNRYIDFNPHVTFHVNHLNNVFLHDDVINIIWWQDLMPQIKNHQLLNWRKNDFNFSISPIFDPHLEQCGAETVERQHFVIDEDIFYSDDEQLRQQKIIFVGSSYLPVVNLASDQQQQVIAELVEILNRGGCFDEQTVASIAARSPFSYEFVFWRLLHYVIRDYSVKWLCQNSTLPVEIYGRYWDQDPLVAPFYRGELQHGVEVADAYRSAAYAIVSHPFEINSQRLVEVAACGCIPVVYDCRDIAEKPHWDDFCLFFKTAEDLKNIIARDGVYAGNLPGAGSAIENRSLPAKSPLLPAQNFTYKAAVDHFIEQSAIKALSNYPAPDAVANHAEPILVELFGDNVSLHSRYPNTIQACRDRLIKNMAALKSNRHELFNQLIAGIRGNNIDIVIDKLIESEYWEISLAINGNNYYRLDNVALLENRQLIHDNSNRYRRENTSCYVLPGMGAGYELLEVFKHTERPIQEMGEFEVPVYVIEQEPGQFLLNMLLHDLEDIIISKRVQFFYDNNSIDQFYLELLKHQVALPTVLLDMKQQGDLKAGQVLELVNLAQHQRNQRHAVNLQEINEYYGSITDSEWRDKFKAENAGSLRVMGFISRFSSFLKYCMRDLLDGFDRTGAITSVCSEEENYYLSNIEHFIEEINRFKPDIILTIDHFRHEFDGVPDSVPFVNWIQDMLPNITGNQQTMKAKDFTFAFSKEWLGFNQEPMYKNSPIGFLPIGYNDRVYFPNNLDKKYDCDVLVVTHLQEPGKTFDPIRDPEEFELILNENEIKIIDMGIIDRSELVSLYRILDDYLSGMSMGEFANFCTMRGGDPVDEFHAVFDKKEIVLEPLVSDVLVPEIGNRLHCEYLSKIKIWPILLLIDSKLDINIQLYGRNWNRYPRFHEFYKGIANNGEQLNRIMNNSKICLNVSPGITLHMRALEIMASCSFMLSRNIELDGSPITEHYSDDQVVLFDSEDDLISKARFYLENDKQRELIARNAYIKTKNAFSYKSIANMISSSIYSRLEN